MNAFAVVILAAGASSRMGRPKLLLPWRGTTVVGHLISQWRELGAAQIAIVVQPGIPSAVGAGEGGRLDPPKSDDGGRPDAGDWGKTVDPALAAELDRLGFPQTDRIVNPQPERGMFSSIVCAANWPAWRTGISTWAIALGDQPHLRTETLRRLLNFAALHADAVCQPVSGGHVAHPAIVPRPVFDLLKTARANSLKDFLKLNAGRSVQVEINDPGLLLDLDTPEDYIKAQGSISAE